MRKNSTFITYLINDFETEADNYKLDAETEELLIVLDIEDFTPQINSVNNILDFARSYEVLESENTGFIELNLN
ncbi:MAG: hypothetical protein HQ541_18245 [Mariniphaga sp.]|nr:hypothetical protein [Mariniphaga sp.]